MSLPTVRAAACHISPHFLSAQKTTDKALRYIRRAASNSANLIAFPESFIPGFPVWSSLLAPTHTHHFFHRFAQESLHVDGPEVHAIRDAARQTQTTVSVGFSEKVQYSTATLFNSNLIIGPDGEIQVHHRKLVPTFFEKLTWTPGDGYGLRVAEMPSGVKVAALICGENTNPLARYSLMAQGAHVHISTWPAVWPTRLASLSSSRAPETQPATHSQSSTASQSSPFRNYDNVLANRTRAAAHCFEAKCFGIMVAAHLSTGNIDTISSMTEAPDSQELVSSALTSTSRAASMFLDPTGAPIPAFVVEGGKEVNTDWLQHEENILYADLDLSQCVEGKQYHDIVGQYQRFDVFSLQVNRRRQTPIVFADDTIVDGDNKSTAAMTGKRGRDT